MQDDIIDISSEDEKDIKPVKTNALKKKKIKVLRKDEK